jgi:aminoglycoside 3-N-acetyltransferase
MSITRTQLVQDFKQLGIRRGDAVLVHSALSAIGNVEDGADGVIDALLEVVGEEGTLLMPTLSSGVFDQAESPSGVGLITETFRKRKGVIRSFHPTHSVAALGKQAEELTRGHLECPTACGEGTPYFKLMDIGGKILLLGVDQDRNTSLHTIEAMVRLPYLKTVTRQYKDPKDGEIKTLEIHEYPGPHRDFIGLDPVFRKEGIMNIGKVGKAVCRLIDAARMREITLRLLQEDATAILCDNPSCQDCVTQRAIVKQTRLEKEDFLLAAVSDVAGNNLEAALDALSREGMRYIELREVNGREIVEFSQDEARQCAEEIRKRGVGITAISTKKNPADWKRLVDVAMAVDAPVIIVPIAAYTDALARYAEKKGILLRVENQKESSTECLELFARLRGTKVSLAFNPAQFAAIGEMPFRRIYSKTALKRVLTQLYLEDRTFAGVPTLLARGNAESKEMVSILRCASFDGPITIKDTAGYSFADYMASFFKLLEEI